MKTKTPAFFRGRAGRAFSARRALALAFAAGGAFVVLLASCARPDARTLRIAGDTPGALAGWRAKIEDQIPPADWHEFDAALQELRWSVKQPDAPANAADASAALAKRVAGATFSEVLRLGCEAKLQRLAGLRTELQAAVDANALLVTQDEASAVRLRSYRREQQERLAALDAELEQARRRFVALGGAPSVATLSAAAGETARLSAPATLSRDDALREIDTFLKKRRDAAIFKYGAWPVKIDEEGAQLPPAEKAEFERRRPAADAAGRVLIAVRLKNRWRIFEDVVSAPKFSSAVTDNLSAGDIKMIAAKWDRLEAEIWTRAQNWADEEKEPPVESPAERSAHPGTRPAPMPIQLAQPSTQIAPPPPPPVPFASPGGSVRQSPTPQSDR